MSSELIRKQLDRTLTVKSLKDLVRVKTAEEILLLIDCSSSMNEHMRNGKSRMEGLKEVVSGIRKSIPKVKMIAFGGPDAGYNGSPAYIVSDVPDRGANGTPLIPAINLAKSTGAGSCVVISDGAPENPNGCLDAAREFGGTINVVYVGDPGDDGEKFLKRLAAATGGTEFHGDMSQPKELAAKISGLLQPHLAEED